MMVEKLSTWYNCNTTDTISKHVRLNLISITIKIYYTVILHLSNFYDTNSHHRKTFPTLHLREGVTSGKVIPFNQTLTKKSQTQLKQWIRPGLEWSWGGRANEFMTSHIRQQHCTRLAYMLLSTDDHREQRPQLCGARTGELKTGPWAGNKTLELCRNAEHSSTINTQHTVTPKSHCHHQWTFSSLHEAGQCSSGWNRGLLCLLAPKLVKCVTAITEQCIIQWGEGSCVWFLYTLGYWPIYTAG